MVEKMSCECDKLRELYERFSSEHLEAICSARNHLSYDGLFKPEYEGERHMDSKYKESDKQYIVEPLFGVYDVAPARMLYKVQPERNIEQKVEVDNLNMLEELIRKAKMEEERWMSLTR
jgi:hypothetical protein